MADFTCPRDQVPVIGRTIPETCYDFGSPVITATAQGAGTQSSGDKVNPSSRGIRVTLDITAKSGTIDVVCNIYAKDIASGKYTLLLASASKTATGTTVLVVHPDLTASANLIAQNFLGQTFKVELVHGAGTTPSTTATVGVCLLP